MFYCLGVDLGGGSKTYAIALREEKNKGLILEKVLSLKDKTPRSSTCEEIIEFVRKKRVLVTAIDAPLSFSLTLEKGLRSSDLALKALLPKENRKWVLSYHALMGIPLRGLLLAEKLSPYCGTIIETHPRASLYFSLSREKKYLADKYKKEALKEGEIQYLKKFFEELFSIEIENFFFYNSDLLDALICALTGYLFLKTPEKLIFLPQDEVDLIGFGPFVIIGESFL